MAKRHSSLVLLSQDHHHGLALALRLRQGTDALLTDGWTHDRAEQAKRVQRFFDDELRAHFRAEEEVVFPVMRKHVPQTTPMIDELSDQHREIETLVSSLRSAEGSDLDGRLVSLGRLLERHIRIEERQLFETMQESLPPDILSGLEDAIKRIHAGS